MRPIRQCSHDCDIPCIHSLLDQRIVYEKRLVRRHLHMQTHNYVRHLQKVSLNMVSKLQFYIRSISYAVSPPCQSEWKKKWMWVTAKRFNHANLQTKDIECCAHIFVSRTMPTTILCPPSTFQTWNRVVIVYANDVLCIQVALAFDSDRCNTHTQGEKKIEWIRRMEGKKGIIGSQYDARVWCAGQLPIEKILKIIWLHLHRIPIFCCCCWLMFPLFLFRIASVWFVLRYKRILYFVNITIITILSTFRLPEHNGASSEALHKLACEQCVAFNKVAKQQEQHEHRITIASAMTAQWELWPDCWHTVTSFIRFVVLCWLSIDYGLSLYLSLLSHDFMTHVTSVNDRKSLRWDTQRIKWCCNYERMHEPCGHMECW